ncbi:MAG TPA: hypothetical protein VHS78_10150 [Candidatus Elarobacter sp.]|nr:hypothetical protein [Candidatus Elarobacter sp.]
MTVVLYVRKQWEYLPRIYCTLLHFGFDEPFDRILETTLERGEFGWREWTFRFDYCEVLRQLRAIPDADVAVRPYEAARTSVCADFLSQLGLTLADLHVPGELVENVSQPLATYVRMFLRNRLGRALDAVEAPFADAIVPAGIKNSAVSPPVQRRLARRFLDVNRRLSLLSGVPELALDDAARATALPDVPYVDLLFSERSDVMSFGDAGVPLP